ncbi:MAG: thiolase family protein [Candidatus Riflebacteria bacterium]|nr:thiolase family protein [Candidatus Riflebacteria bacterium]
MPEITPIFTAGLRTPFATAHRGAYREIRPDDLLVSLFKAHRERFPLFWSAGLDDVVVGCAYPEGEQGYNVARMAGLGAGITAPGLTVNRLCGSSLEAALIAAAFVRSGRGTRFLVGGVESMSRVPRRGGAFSESPLVAAASPRAYVTMGETAEELASLHPDLTRAAQEECAALSHERAHAAYAAGWYHEQIVPTGSSSGLDRVASSAAEPGGIVPHGGPFASLIPPPKPPSGSPSGLTRDEGIRHPANREKMASLAPSFREGGVVTAATSSPLSDGAACGVVLAESEAVSSGLTEGLRVIDAVASHVAPEVMGLGPVPAVRQLMARNGLSWRDVAAVEMNEAFAVQVLACRKELELDPTIVNLWGGALAVGHPLGASGLRLMMTLQGRLKQRGKRGALGIATLCVGGGQGVAVLCEYVQPGR